MIQDVSQLVQNQLELIDLFEKTYIDVGALRLFM